MPETLTRFVLELLVDEWPEPSFPDDLHRIDRNESVILETDEPSQGDELTSNAVLSVGRDTTDHAPEGTSPIYETVEILDVEIQALDARQYGTVESHAEFRRLVDNVKLALDTERSLPDISLLGRDRQPTRLSMFIGDEQDRSTNQRSHYAVGFPLRLRGKLDIR
jgi:hypothetical protein